MDREGAPAIGGEFDDVLIADATGNVLFQKSSVGPRVVDMKPLILESAGDSKQKTSETFGGDHPLELATQSSNKASQSVDDADLEPARHSTLSLADAKLLQRLTDTSFFTHITLAGQGYELLSVPVRIPLNSIIPGKPWRLVVCGLRRTDSFEADSHAIPYSTLVWATLVAVAIFALSWPLLKLRYMSNTERFSPKDWWLLVLTIFLASTSVTLVLLNGSYTSRVGDETDRNLKCLANQIKANFKLEMKRASDQMQGLHPGPSGGDLMPDYLGTSNWSLDLYPYFEIAFWVDRTGKQVRKFDIRPSPTPLIHVGQLPFFSRAVSDAKWSSDSSDVPDGKSAGTGNPTQGELFDHYYLDPEISPTTAEFAPALAAHYNATPPDNIAVQALVVRPMSLVDARRDWLSSHPSGLR